MLEVAAARRGNLAGQIAERESSLARAEGEWAAAQAEFAAALAYEQRATTRLGHARADVRAVEQTLQRRPSVLFEQAGFRIAGASGSGLVSLPRPAGLSAMAPAKPTLSPTYQHTLRRLAHVVVAAGAQEQDVKKARERGKASQQAMSAAATAADSARRSLTAVREELWLAMRDDPATRQARALTTSPDGHVVDPTPFALADIPGPYLELYRRAAATCAGLSWTVIAAIGTTESSHGRLDAPGVRSGSNFAGAMGPMQFLAQTWSSYAVDGDGDGSRDVYAPADAIFGAANYLCASGAGNITRLAEAVWAYNHADWYVDDVLALALRYGVEGLGLGEGAADVKSLVESSNLTLSDEAKWDLLNGIADPRVVKVLAAASSNHRIAVSVIKTGHSQYVAGTDRISNHYYGRGVDIYAVDGENVSAANGRALDLALALLTSGIHLRPDELGSPWPELARFPGAFSDEGHRGHLHVAWRSEVG